LSPLVRAPSRRSASARARNLFRGGDWRLRLLFSLKTVVAGPECSKQAETRLTSFHTIFRNARLSTGPVTEEGKRRSRQNAVRHGLTAETVIDALEDAEDYAAFEMAVTADYDAQSAVERELVTIESGLFKIQARHLLQFRQTRQAHEKRQEIIDSVYRNALATQEDVRQDEDEPRSSTLDPGSASTVQPADPSDDLTRSFANLPTYPLDRLSRYEATLWRQACQILFTLQCLDRRKLWDRRRLR
jgi:hypothetical protein